MSNQKNSSMKELKCPKCGNVFQVDEADYASIANQVKNAEFHEEVEKRLAEIVSQKEAEAKVSLAEADTEFNKKLNAKDNELSEKSSEIERLKQKIEGFEEKKKLEIQTAVAGKDKEIAELKSTIAKKDGDLKLAIMEEKQNSKEALQSKESEITKLKSQAELDKKEAELNVRSLNDSHAMEVKALEEQVAFYKDFKARKSTKDIGESLEKYCYKLYNQYLRPVMPNAYFDKDNETVDGTKGDFIFRDSEDGLEYISIEFEMKNEADGTENKHKNSDFFKKLDEDRKKKDCEFAVLVTTLEKDNDMYNDGIVVAPGYDKMYVVRPENFIPIITLLVQTSKKSLEYKKQLILAQSKEVDVTNFEAKMEDFKSKFGRHYELASKKFGDAVKDIDATIAKLQKIRDELVGSANNLRLASQDTEDLTIKKLTYKNPTMKRKFEEARGLTDAEILPDED